MKTVTIILSVLLAACLCGCAVTEQGENETMNATYKQIDHAQAKDMMDEQPNAIILDVREQAEYDSGHIPGAALLPVGEINEDSAAQVIPDKDTVVLVYCRSGNRSKKASQALAELGYTQVYEFGGIMDWPYDIE